MATIKPPFIFLYISILLITSLLISLTHANDPHLHCSKECVVFNCNSMGIRYGKYCGLGHFGCPGEKPCDELDACCEIHDECVGKHDAGMVDIGCHEMFKACLKKVQKSGKVGFTKQCPYKVVIPIMLQGTDMAISMSQLVERRVEL